MEEILASSRLNKAEDFLFSNIFLNIPFFIFYRNQVNLPDNSCGPISVV